ncbi:restriction endonuclease FokI C-terminal domain-containing protein [Microbacterium sp.]|uniref:restriction endonuclease FokI C-terminal domain-containing protein n=1 Tax=Microbacterium sp. TaxID=51671 RepID=UPI003C1AD826
MVSTKAEARKWSHPDKRIELAVESGLEEAGLKRPGRRRDGGGGGARTYRAWLKSLGLVFMDDDDRLWPTLAGDAILQGEPPLPIMSKLVLSTQFPSAFTASGQSAVNRRFQVRPFIFLLQLLDDPRLGGYLDEKEEIAKIVICYGESNKQSCVDSVVERILSHREHGDASLPEDYVDRFKSTRSKAPSLDAVFKNFADIANTLGNQLSFTQLVSIQRGGRWEIASQGEGAVRDVIAEYLTKPLLRDADDEEKYQRRFGLPPGKHKDTRTLDPLARSITGAAIAERQITTTFLTLSSAEIITTISPDLVTRVADITGLPAAVVDGVLARKFPAGGIDTFMTEYAVLAFGSRDRATEFEKATASIFSNVFGFQTLHIGQQGIRPDVVVSSRSDSYAGIIDAKAYGESYSASHDHRNRMVAYIKGYKTYAIDDNPLAFFSYVVSEFKPTITGQLAMIQHEAGVPGSAITARDIIRMVERSKVKAYTHAELLGILGSAKGLTFNDLLLQP